jgi:hypothetical protein
VALYAVFDWVDTFDSRNIAGVRLLILPCLLLILLPVRAMLRRGGAIARLLTAVGNTAVGALAILGCMAIQFILWLGDAGLFYWHTAFVCLWLLTVFALRPGRVSVLATLAIAVSVVLLQCNRPEFEAWRAAGPWAFVVLWSMARSGEPVRLRNGLLLVVFLSIWLGRFQLTNNRYVAPTRDRLAAMWSQPGVEVVFQNDTSDLLPVFRMELLCAPETGSLYVTPHDHSRLLAEITTAGEILATALPRELADQGAIDGRFLYTSQEGELAILDLVTHRFVFKLPVCEGEMYYVHRSPDGKRLAVSCQEPLECFVLNLRDGRWFPEPEPFVTEECQFAGGDRLVVGPVHRQGFLGFGVRLVDLPSREVLKEISLGTFWLPVPFNQVFADLANRRLYFPRLPTGVVQVLDLDSLEPLGRFVAEPGLRGVLVDESDEQRVFTWNYSTGRIHEHRMPGGDITRSWDAGPLVRKVNWDCDRRSLLVVSSQGGFRIRL